MSLKTEEDLLKIQGETGAKLVSCQAEEQRLVGVRADYNNREWAARRELVKLRQEAFRQASLGHDANIPKLRLRIEKLTADRDFYAQAARYVDHFPMADTNLATMLAQLGERTATRDLLFFQGSEIRRKNAAVLGATTDRVEIKYTADSKSQQLLDQAVDIDKEILNLRETHQKRMIEVQETQAETAQTLFA